MASLPVYQITDRKELISSGEHWILREEYPENEQILVCEGCAECRQTDLPPIRFILPWAFDPDSELCQKLRAEPAKETVRLQVCYDLKTILPKTMLFLCRLESIEVIWDEDRVFGLERLEENGSLILTDGSASSDEIWHIIQSDFDEAAAQLREEHPGRVEAKKSSKVRLAIAENPALLERGVPFAAFLRSTT